MELQGGYLDIAWTINQLSRYLPLFFYSSRLFAILALQLQTITLTTKLYKLNFSGLAYKLVALYFCSVPLTRRYQDNLIDKKKKEKELSVYIYYCNLKGT